MYEAHPILDSYRLEERNAAWRRWLSGQSRSELAVATGRGVAYVPTPIHAGEHIRIEPFRSLDMATRQYTYRRLSGLRISIQSIR